MHKLSSIRNFLEHISLPPIDSVNNDLTVKRVFSKLGQNNCPNYPVNTTGSNDAKANNAVKVVRQRLVNAVAVAGWHKRCNDEVDIAEEEEYGDRQRGLDRRVPVGLLLVEVQPRQTGGNEGIDDGKWV